MNKFYLPEGRKVIFGTGDYWSITTLANYKRYVQIPSETIRLPKKYFDSVYDCIEFFCLNSRTELGDFVPCPY